MSLQSLKQLRFGFGVKSILRSSSTTHIRQSNSRLLATPSRKTPSSYHLSRASSILGSRHFATTTMKFTTPSMDPPKHEMAYFPNMTTSLPSESGEFRRVLWTGLYSQLVLMTVPVDGEIGDEVCPCSFETSNNFSSLAGGIVILALTVS